MLQLNAPHAHPAIIVLRVELNSQQVFAMQVTIVLQDKLPLSQLLMFVRLVVTVKSALVKQLLADQATTIHQQE